MSVYLDHAATTPLRPEALQALTETFGLVGNPSSIHTHGQNARRLLEEARETVAETLGCDPVEIIFTSGGTESINLAIKGIYAARQALRPRPVIAVGQGEHHATSEAVEFLQSAHGARPQWLPLDSDGRIVDYDIEKPDETALVTFLAVNNEVGTVQAVADHAVPARSGGVPVHVDAVAAYGHIPVSLGGWGVDAISVSAHKIGGPVGIGALAVTRTLSVVPLLHGGGQQRRVRSGTQDVAAAVAFAAAARAAELERQAENKRLSALRDRLVAGVRAAIPEAVLSGPPISSDDRVATIVHFVFPGAQGDSLLFLLDLDGFSVSTGSACTAGIPEPSHVIRAMHRSEADARSALRFSMGRTTTTEDIDALVAALPHAYARARQAGLSERAPRHGGAATA